MQRRAKRALLLVDYINLFAFAHSEKLAKRAVKAARNAAKLKARLRKARIPCIYANDNFGHWHSEFSALVRACEEKGGASATIAELLRPSPEDISVLKPRHSAFYETPLDFLLEKLGISSLVIAGLSTDICVLVTAQDAHVRKFDVWVPSDCSAADTLAHEKEALDLLHRTIKVDTRPSA